jgi:hypothetical protein
MASTRFFKVIIALAVLVLALAGCGGGGGPYAPRIEVTAGGTFIVNSAPPQVVFAGNTATYVISTAVNGSVGTTETRANAIGSVSFTVESGLPSGAVATFNPPTVTPGESTTLTVTTLPNTPAGFSQLTVRASQGSDSVNILLDLTVTQSNFALSAPNFAPVAPGGDTSTTVTSAVVTNAEERSTGDIDLSVTNGLPTGATATFAPAAISETGTSTLTVQTSPTTPPGTYTLTVSGSRGTRTNTASVTLTVLNNFALTASPFGTVQAGNSTTSDIDAIFENPAQGRHNEPIELSVTSTLPAGVTASFNRTGIEVGGSAVLTLSTAATTVQGTYDVTVTGVRHGVTRTVTVPFTVTANFTVNTPATQTIFSSDPATFTFIASNFNQQTRGQSTVDWTVTSTLPTGMTATFAPTSSNINAATSLNVTTTLSTPAGTYDILVNANYGGTNVVGVARVIVKFPSPFTLSSTGNVMVVQGGSASNSVTPLPGAPGIPAGTEPAAVTLSVVSTLPTGMTVTFGPNPVLFNNASTVTFNAANSTPPGVYNVELEGFNGYWRARTSFQVFVDANN